MPVIKIKHIVSFSSEDSGHKAVNLLSGDTTRKWKCAAGEKQASVIFQLEKSTLISGIDIGNEGSAFIEVLVGRSSIDTVQYQVILVASSFMSPQESRQGASPNRVRMFEREKLAPSVASQKWDLVKIVCTQPFNKRSTYGLSFVKFHTTEDNSDESTTPAAVDSMNQSGRKSFGSFKLKEEVKSDYHPGVQMQLFHMAKKGNLDISLSQMSQCRTADDAKKLLEDEKKTKEARRRPSSPDHSEIEEKRRKTEVKSFTQSMSTPVKFANLQECRKAAAATKQKQHKPKQTQPQTFKVKSSDPSLSSAPIKNRPYNKILDGVVFVISGFQNPLRSEVREKGLAMGALYRKDWTPDSTHLVCAFPNTPKFREVFGKGGKIVCKDWFYDCASQRKRLSWRKYAMGSKPSDESSSEEEMQAEVAAPDTTTKAPGSSSKQEDEKMTKTVILDKPKEDEDPYEASTDAGDTDDEIERITAKANGNKSDNNTDDDDIYNASTDEDLDDQVKGNGLPYLPDFLSEKHFLLYGEFQPRERKQIRRHVISCGGSIVEYMNEDVDYVVTEQPWDEKFDAALTDNASLVFVRPTWLFHCSSEQRIVPYQPYVVSP